MSLLKPLTRLAVFAVAGSITLAPIAYAKHASFDLPACDRLMEGDGPNGGQQAAPAKTSSASGTANLAPMKLTDDNNSFQVGADGKMKVTVEENVTKKEEQTAEAVGDKPESVIKTDKGDLSQKLLKDAKKVNLGPIPVCESDDEAQKKVDTIGDAQRQQLTDLWAATIQRSPDIQFVINRLQPQSDPNHATSTALKLIGGALFSAMQAVPFALGGATPGLTQGLMYSGVGSAQNMLGTLISGQDAKNAKKQQISQEQATILYKIVRDTADKLVIEYRNYRKSTGDLDRANRDLEDLKGMVATARNGQDAAKQIEMEYTLRKQQRDSDSIAEEVRLHRQQLIDLAGDDALAKLDNSIEQEKTALAKLTGGQLEQNGGTQTAEGIQPQPTATTDASSVVKQQTAAKPGQQDL